MTSTYLNITDKGHNTRVVRVSLLHAQIAAIDSLAKDSNTGFSQALIVFLSAHLKTSTSTSTATHGTNDNNNSASR